MHREAIKLWILGRTAWAWRYSFPLFQDIGSWKWVWKVLRYWNQPCPNDNKLQVQKQPFRWVLIKGCSENMQGIYMRTTILKCDFNKVVLQLYWNHTSTWVFSCTVAENWDIISFFDFTFCLFSFFLFFSIFCHFYFVYFVFVFILFSFCSFSVLNFS